MDQELSLFVNINVKLVSEVIYTVGTTYPHKVTYAHSLSIYW